MRGTPETALPSPTGHSGWKTGFDAVLIVLGFLFLGGCSGTKSSPAGPGVIDFNEKPVLEDEQRLFVAHEFFLRARKQEMLGNDAMALGLYQIAFEYDGASRDLCFILTEKLKAADRLDSALVLGDRCMTLSGDTTTSELQSLAEIHLRMGRVQQALEYYTLALGKSDGNRDLLYTLATLYDGLKDAGKHAGILEELLPKIDYPVRLVEKQAANYKSLGRLQEVAGLYRKAWDRTANPLFGERLADFFEEQGLHNSALDIHRRLAEENPQNVHYKLEKARGYLLVDLVDSALTAYADLVEKHPDERELMTPYATLLFEKGRFAEAREIFGELAKGQPDNPAFQYFLGSIAVELGDSTMAESALLKAIELDDKAPEYWARLAFFYMKQGREKDAVKLLEDMTGVLDKSWFSWYMQGVVQTQLARKMESPGREGGEVHAKDQEKIDGFRRRGVENFEKALALDAGNRRVLFEMGVALERLGRKAEAIGVMKDLVKIDSTDAIILNYLGYMLVEEARELEYAIKLIDKALQAEPENGAFLDSKGWWYYQTQNYPDARLYIEKALAFLPNDTTILEHYALILEKLGDKQAAMEQWRAILRLDPGHGLASQRLE